MMDFRVQHLRPSVNQALSSRRSVRLSLLATRTASRYHGEGYCYTVTVLLLYHAKPCYIILKDSEHTVGVNFPASLISPELYRQKGRLYDDNPSSYVSRALIGNTTSSKKKKKKTKVQKTGAFIYFIPFPLLKYMNCLLYS